MIFLKMKLFYLIACFGLLSLVVPCSAGDGDGDEGDDKESKEMEAFMRLMIKSSQKHLKRMIETLDIGSLVGAKCNSSWHQFMADNELSPERFSTMIEDYKSGNHDKIVKLVRPEQCLSNENGQFCQLDHLTNVTMRSKAKVFDLTYALCYPRGCSNDELNSILAAMTDSSKSMMIQIKLNVVKCITSMENVNKMEIETAQKMMSKLNSNTNQTLDFGPFKLPGLRETPTINQPVPSQPKFAMNVPDDIPLFSLEDLSFSSNSFSTAKPPLTLPTPPTLKPTPPTYSPSSIPSYLLPPSSSSTTAPPPPAAIDNPLSWKPSMVDSNQDKPASPPIITPHPAFRWPEAEPAEPEEPNPFRFPEVLYSDEVESKPTTPKPLDIKQYDKTRLVKMIPGLIVQDE